MVLRVPSQFIPPPGPPGAGGGGLSWYGRPPLRPLGRRAQALPQAPLRLPSRKAPTWGVMGSGLAHGMGLGNQQAINRSPSDYVPYSICHSKYVKEATLSRSLALSLYIYILNSCICCFFYLLACFVGLQGGGHKFASPS